MTGIFAPLPSGLGAAELRALAEAHIRRAIVLARIVGRLEATGGTLTAEEQGQLRWTP